MCAEVRLVQECVPEIRKVELCTFEIKSRKISGLVGQGRRMGGVCLRLRGKLPDKSQIFKLFCMAGLARRDVAVDVMLVLSGGALTPSAGIVD